MKSKQVFYHEHAKRELCCLNAGHKAELYGECIVNEEGDCGGTGWYYVLPASNPVGPFLTQAKATQASKGVL